MVKIGQKRTIRLKRGGEGRRWAEDVYKYLGKPKTTYWKEEREKFLGGGKGTPSHKKEPCETPFRRGGHSSS